MQLVYIGYFQVGGVGSMDMGIISFPCVALAIASDIDTTAAIALATGLATVFTSIDYVVRVFCAICGNYMKKAAEEGKWKKFGWFYVGFPTIFYLLERGLPSFLLIYLGTGAVDSVMGLLPPAIVTAFSAIAKFLPAIGMAALMGYLVEDAWGIVFFLFGFACYEYLGLSTTGIIFVAVIIAYFYYRTMGRPKQATASNIADEEEII